MELNEQEILSHFQNVKQRGEGIYQASCPLGYKHTNGDQHQSLSITFKDGKLLMYCNGCSSSFEEMLEAAGLRQQGNGKAYQERRQDFIAWYAKQNSLQFVEEYNYCYGKYRDGLAKLRFKDTKGEKTFRWIQDDPNKKSGFSMSHNGCPNRLYTVGNLKDSEIVAITEGEKDAITAYKLLHMSKFAAASPENGATKGEAKKKWLPVYNEQLQGKDVYIFQDNDEAGKHFARIAAHEANKTANRVYIIDIAEGWKDCPEKGDITDLYEALGEEQAYSVILDLLENPEPLPKDGEEQETDPLQDFFAKIQGEAYRPYQTGLQWYDNLLGGGIVQQSLITLMAAPAAGKTTLCQQIAEEMASRGNDVLYFNLEMSKEQMYAKALSYWLAKKKRKFYTTLQILQGYKWDDAAKADISAAMVEYRGNSYPHITYNPDGMDGTIEGILEYLNEVGESCKVQGKQAPAVVMDYLHLLGSRERIDLQEIIKKTVFGLKRYAKDYNTFVIAISASNRESNKKGRLSLGSGRDSSNLEYTADYTLSLNYYEIEQGDKDADNPADMDELQAEKYRRMVLRVLKGRLSQAGKTAEIYFDAAHNIFYGDGDWLPADAGISPFEKTAAKKKGSVL